MSDKKLYALIKWVEGEDRGKKCVVNVCWIRKFVVEEFNAEIPDIYMVEWRNGKKPAGGNWESFEAEVLEICECKNTLEVKLQTENAEMSDLGAGTSEKRNLEDPVVIKNSFRITRKVKQSLLETVKILVEKEELYCSDCYYLRVKINELKLLLKRSEERSLILEREVRIKNSQIAYMTDKISVVNENISHLPELVTDKILSRVKCHALRLAESKLESPFSVRSPVYNSNVSEKEAILETLKLDKNKSASSSSDSEVEKTKKNESKQLSTSSATDSLSSGPESEKTANLNKQLILASEKLNKTGSSESEDEITTSTQGMTPAKSKLSINANKNQIQENETPSSIRKQSVKQTETPSIKKSQKKTVKQEQKLKTKISNCPKRGVTKKSKLNEDFNVIFTSSESDYEDFVNSLQSSQRKK